MMEKFSRFWYDRFGTDKGGMGMNREIEHEQLKTENQRLRDTIRQLNRIIDRLIEEYIVRTDSGPKQPR